jgi:UDP-N-acetylglucosamine 1-carboxyvinyltransferase
LSSIVTTILKWLHNIVASTKIDSMATYLIAGGKPLKGKITISGNKNSVLPCIAATLLTEEPVTLHNVPKISDVGVFKSILQNLGVSVSEQDDHTITVTAEKISTTTLPKELITKVRASILFVGPLLAREGGVEFSHPGGDIIGKRTIEPHLEGLEALGFSIHKRDLDYRGSGKLTSTKIDMFLDEASVTGTENLLLATALKESETVLRNCATEPHVVDLCNLLVAMGVEIDGIGSSTLTVRGKKELHGAEFTIGPDYIQMGTYAIAAAVSQGEITMTNCPLEGLEPVTKPLEKMGLIFKRSGDAVIVSAKDILPREKLHVNIWPGFPSDLMSLAIVLATQAKGISLCHDWMYESRMFFVDKLISMGAHITIADPHRVLVYGPTALVARNMETPDIRAGMALVLAALIAEGTSTINRAELIERGYEDVVETLQGLGAQIERVSTI